MVFGVEHWTGYGLAVWTSCRCRRIGTDLVAETAEDLMTAVEVDTSLGSGTTVEIERIASAVHVVDRGRLKSVGSLRQFAERSGIESKDSMARIHGTKVLGRLEEMSHGNPGPIVLVQA